MTTLSKDFTATGESVVFQVGAGDWLEFIVEGTFVGTVKLQKSITLGIETPTWEDVYTKTAAFSDVFQAERDGDEGSVWYRMSCSAFTSGTIETSLENVSAPATLADAVVAENVAEVAVTSLTISTGAINAVVVSLVNAGIMKAP